MPRRRKTFEVEDLRNMVNNRNLVGDDSPEEDAARKAGNALLTIVLQKTGNYKGFKFNHLAARSGSLDDFVHERFGPSDPEHSRRHYF